jgi:hypothetical protein
MLTLHAYLTISAEDNGVLSPSLHLQATLQARQHFHLKIQYYFEYEMLLNLGHIQFLNEVRKKITMLIIYYIIIISFK